jgi:hypothetical protein
MAISTKTIQNTIDFCKRLNFMRNPVIGNSLEPALTAATIVLQVILGPPFEWWWNSEELVFTCNPVPNSATSTAVTVSNGLLTVTAANTFIPGQLILPSALATLTQLNGFLIEIATANAAGFTANVQGISNGTDTVGTFTNLTTQDYTIPAPVFSHIEHASVLDLSSTGAPLKWYELTVKNDLSLETSQNRPMFISPEIEDGNGNVTFRVASAPDKKYPITLHVQLAAPAVTSINQTWAPLPDFMQYIYTWGFMALMWQFADDPQRAAWANSKFVTALLARADGLDDEQKNIFLNNWDELRMGFGPMKQQGIQARQQ